MRIAVVPESFLPAVNGVTNSVLRVLEHLERTGHQATVIAPDYDGVGPTEYAGAPVVRVPSVPAPGGQGFRVGLPSRRIQAALAGFRPDVVHLASPFVLGAEASRAARALGVPVVAVFQTHVAGFAKAYGSPSAAQAVAWSWLRRIHTRADLTLAPSPTVCTELRRRGFERLALWPRGVDTARFAPSWRDPDWRRQLGVGEEEVLVGYVGRLAPEKRVGDLAALSGLPGTRLVLIGHGPQAAALAQQIPGAIQTGHLDGEQLSRAYAALDVFVHVGPDETFCQAAQEAMASALPVVAVRAGALPDLVTSGRTGTLVPSGDLAALREAVWRYAERPDLRAAHGAAGRAQVLDRSWSVLGEALLDHYRSLVKPLSAPETEAA